MQSSASVIATEMERVSNRLPVIYDLDALFYAEVEKRPVEVISERDMRIPMNLQPGGYFGYYDPDGGDLGVGDGPVYNKAVINTNHFKFGVQWTKKAEWGTDDSRKSVINTFRDLMAKSMPEFRRQTDNQCHTDGTGVLATVTSFTTLAGVDTVVCTTDGYGVRLLRPNQRVIVYNAAMTIQRNVVPVKITYYDIASNTIKWTPAVPGLANTDVIVAEGLAGANPTGLFGLPYHINSASTGFWLGYDRSATPEIRGNSVDAGGSGLAIGFPRLAINKIGNRVGINERTKLVARMHPAQVQAYENLGYLATIVQKQATDQELNLFFSPDNVRLAGAPAKVDYSQDKKRIDFLKMDTWGRAELHPAGFYTVDGRRIFEMRGPSGGVATSQVFYLVASWNLFTDNPAAQAYIYNLAVPVGY